MKEQNKYPIVQIKTSDGFWLHGLFIEASKSDTVFINIHGTASNFYEEYFIEVMTRKFTDAGISMLSVNNRGAGVYDAWQGIGAAVEKFEDCIVDIDAWVSFALDKGYKNIVLSGHSLGTEKVVYYMKYGKFVDNIRGVVLLAPADSFGSHRIHNGKDNLDVYTKVQSNLELAGQLIKEGKGNIFLPRDTYGSHGGIMPKTAESFVNFLGPDSKLNEGLPFVSKNLDTYSKINVPILVAIGDQVEYTGLTVKDTLELMQKENHRTTCFQLKNCDHDFQGKEVELTKIVLDFIKSL